MAPGVHQPRRVTHAGRQAPGRRPRGGRLETIGFFTIVGHGVPVALTRRTYDVSREFFDLPLDEKLRVKRPRPERARRACG